MVPGLHEHLLNSFPQAITQQTPILDIGCGTGAWLERLANAGFEHLHGIDQDTEQFRSQKATCSNADLDFGDLGLGEKKFSLITAIEVIEHLENVGRLFYHVANLLEPDGYFLVTTPNLHSLVGRMRFFLTGNMRQFDDKGEQTHISPILLTPLNRIIKRYNLEIVKEWSYPQTESVTSRASLKLVSSILSSMLNNELPGDILCLLIQKNNAK